MKTLIFLFVVIFVIGAFVNSGFAQNTPGVPNGAVSKDSRDEYDNGIRLRSIELERIKRESYRSAIAEKAAENRKINYPQIKNDFEHLQKLQNEIVKTYVTGKQINYGRIGRLADELNECAERLDKNLLLSAETAEKESAGKRSDPDDVRDLIVVLDRSIGKFVTSSIFKNLNIIKPKDAEKAEFELKKIIHLSDFLARKAKNQKQ